MLKFIKNYWINIVVISIIAILLLILIPYQEKGYLKSEVKIIEKKALSALLWTELVLVVLLFIKVFPKLKKRDEFVYSFFGIAS